MGSVSFDDVVGETSTDPEAAAHFLEWWHGEHGGFVNLFALPMCHGWSAEVGVLAELLREADVVDLIYPENGNPQNLYHVVGGFGKRPDRKDKGCDRDISTMPGAVLDIDVKGTGYHTAAEVEWAVSVLDWAGLAPDAVVATGSGGMHAYFRVQGGVAPEVGREMGDRLRVWLSGITGRGLDNVSQPARIMRLPGTVRWPKAAESTTKAAPVTVVRQRDTWTTVEKVWEVTEEAWQADRAAARRRRRDMDEQWASLGREVAEMTDDLLRNGVLPAGVGWDAMYLLAIAEEGFNRDVTWARILEGRGWVRHGSPDSEGRQQWTRPGNPVGRNPRSATTDWRESPNVMSLLSSSEDTGLTHLLRDGIALTKVRVAAALWANGDTRAVILNYFAEKKEQFND